MAEPFDATIGEPDIPGIMLGPAVETERRPPKCLTMQGTMSPVSENNDAGPSSGASAIGKWTRHAKRAICVRLFGKFLIVRTAQHCDVGNWISEAAFGPHLRLVSDWGK
jgi:hypothetical protein